MVVVVVVGAAVVVVVVVVIEVIFKTKLLVQLPVDVIVTDTAALSTVT